MLRSRASRVLESIYPMNAAQILRASIRVALLHPNHFHSISIFLFSPLPISLFLSHFLVHRIYHIHSSALDHFFENYSLSSIPNLLSRTVLHVIICFPSSITFSLLGKAATIQAVSDSYNGIILDGRRLFVRSCLAWIKLVHTSFWELVIVLGLFGTIVSILAVISSTLFIGSLGFWIILGFLGVTFCLAFAHVMVVGNLARVVSVLERDCYGLEALIKAKSLVEGRRHTALVMALISNTVFRLIECLFDYRMHKGMGLWEGYVLVSMYSLGLVFETVMNVVFYYACKP